MRNSWKPTRFIVHLIVIAFTSTVVPYAFALDPIHKIPAKKGPITMGGNPSMTGMPYHNEATLICSDCHVMHASAGHDYEGASNAYTGTENAKLLKASDSTDLCLACHDGMSGVPDVVGPDVNGLTERSAGFFQNPNVSNPNGHTLGTGLVVGDYELCMRCHFRGSYVTAKITCVDCHNPHGNKNARNLQWAGMAGSEPPFGLFVNPSATGMAKYERANVGYGTQDSDMLREVSNMCLDCHHKFSGASYTDPNGDGIHSRHPSYDSERLSPNNILQGALKGTTDPTHWLDGVGSGFTDTPRVPFVVKGASDFASATKVDANNNGVFCLSCHKAHGSSHAFGLTYEAPKGTNAKGCDQCHNIGA